MKSDSLRLPSGTTMTVCGHGIILCLEWRGPSGVYVVRLEQAIDWGNDDRRDEAVHNAVGLFRNIVYLEKLDESLHSEEPAQPHVE